MAYLIVNELYTDVIYETDENNDIIRQLSYEECVELVQNLIFMF